MTTFRKTLMATTMLAGLAIFALDAAQAGPNGGPSLGSISGFSSMRMDFNRVGGPSRALSRDDTRVVPLEVKKTEKSKDTKNAAKKGIDVARVSNPKPATGGKGKEDVSAPSVRIPAPLAEIYRVTGGNLKDLSQLAMLAGWLKTGPLAFGNPFFMPADDGSFVPPTLGTDGRFGWGDTKGGPGNTTPQRIASPDGKAAGDAWRVTGSGHTGNGIWIEFYNKQENRYRVYHSNLNDDRVMYEYAPGREPGTNLPVSTTRIVWVTGDIVITAGEMGSEKEAAEKETVEAEKETVEKEKPEGEKPEKEKDSQPADGTDRPRGMHTVRCDIAGCIDLGTTDGRRVNPGHAEGSGSASGGGSALPSWATDPCPDCTSRGGGGGYSGYDPRNEGDGNVGGNGGRGTPL